jgi:hypothetical protein
MGFGLATADTKVQFMIVNVEKVQVTLILCTPTDADGGKA